MSFSFLIHSWRVHLRMALVLLAFLLCLLCVLAGIRPNWLGELYIVRVSSPFGRTCLV